MSDQGHRIPRRETGPEIPGESLDRAHEQRDLGLNWLFIGLLTLAVLVVVTLFGMQLLFESYEAREAARDPRRSPLVEAPTRPPEPRLESTPGEILDRLRATERTLLESYVWVDRESGLARIPVDRAMDILVERGLPWRGPPAIFANATVSDGAPESEQ